MIPLTDGPQLHGFTFGHARRFDDGDGDVSPGPHDYNPCAPRKRTHLGPPVPRAAVVVR